MSNKMNQRLKRIERDVAKAERAERDYRISEWHDVDKYYKQMKRKSIEKKRAIERRSKRIAMERAWFESQYIDY